MGVLKIIGFLFLVTACGNTNFFSYIDGPDVAERASKYLEKNQSDSAISLLLDALGDRYQVVYKEFENSSSDLITGGSDLRNAYTNAKALGVPSKTSAANLVSILASSVAQKWGIDILDLAIAMTKSNSTKLVADTGGFSTLSKLFPVLPEATADSIHGVNLAAALIQSLQEDASQNDQFKLALYLISSVALSFKSLDIDGDGTISVTEILNMPISTAQLIVETIASAAIAAVSAEVGSTGEGASSSITSIQTAIDSSPGSSTQEKLQNFVINQTN